MLKRYLHDLGPLRTMLALLAVLLIAAAPFADGHLHTGWRFWPEVIAPTLMVMVSFLLPLDITMTRVFMSDADGDTRARYRHVLWIDAILLIALLSAWTPFYFRLTS